MKLDQEDFTGKTVLEIGCGRGDTTRRLESLLARYTDTTLIATDISDAHFQKLSAEFKDSCVDIRFVCTAAHELKNIADGSVDFVVCNYTLCAINAREGLATLALRKFRDVLKPGGWLSIEEEFPISYSQTACQQVWSIKWRILKAATILTGDFPYAEIAPEALSDLCRLLGFQNVQWTAERQLFVAPAALDFFQKRLERLLPALPNRNLQTGFGQMALTLRDQAAQVGGMEIPYYCLSAQKSLVI